MRGKIRLALDTLLQWLYPTRCVFCHKLSHSSQVLVCAECDRELPKINIHAQKRIFKNVDAAVAPFYYEGRVRESFLRYKFHGLKFYAEVYANFMAKCVDENGINCDIITWAPLSGARRHKRGYDQAKLLAEETARLLGGIECAQLLKKRRNNPAQSKMTKATQKEKNVKGLYAALAPELIKGKHILLIDDICTTGSTIKECARVLKASGAASVCAATLARKRD